QQDKPGVGVIRRRAVGALPQRVADAGRRRADVRVRVVAVNAPGLQHALDVAVVAGPAHVVHHFIAAAFDERLANLSRERVEHFVPGGALPLAFAARADAFQREEDAFGVVDLVDSGRPLGAVTPARRRVLRVAFELANLARL